MRLVIDANSLVAELLQQRGRALLRNPELEIYLAEQVRNEAEYKLRNRISRIVTLGRLSKAAGQEQFEAALWIVNYQIRLVPAAFYNPLESEARKRIPRDSNDWSTVALALALPATIWTQDYDFFGCGCPTWTTETLTIQLSSDRS